MSTLKARYLSLLERIGKAESTARRPRDSVRLLAVSKRHPVEAIRELHGLGQAAFGENYVAEALEKMEALADLAIEWHYIGPIQSNKTRAIAEHFDWVQSVDREKLLRRLSDQRPAELGELQLLIQVHIGEEASKSGCPPEQLERLCRLATELPRLRLRGLMAIPPPSDTVEDQRHWFAELAELYRRQREAGYPMDTLSMGMTADLEAAVAEGSTLLRIGTALFGPRPG